MSLIRANAVMLLLVLAMVFVCPTTGKSRPKLSRLAKYIPNLCKKLDPELYKCMISNIMKDVVEYAHTGIPELNLPSFEPIFIKEIDLKIFQGISNSIFGSNIFKSKRNKGFVRNLRIYNASQFIIQDLKTNIEQKKVYIDLKFPQIEVEGEYDLNIWLFNQPIKSRGPVFLNITDYSIQATLYGKTLKRNNITYLHFDTVDIKMDHTDYLLVFEKVFNKDSVLNRALNDVLRSRNKELKKLTGPMNEEMAGRMILEMMNKILAALPLEDLFLPEL